MTVVVAFLCTDGVVIAADSMLTPSVGGVSVGHHKGKKVEVISGPQVFAFAGDHGQAARFKFMADTGVAILAGAAFSLDYALGLSIGIVDQFKKSGILDQMNVNAVLAFTHKGIDRCCVFEGRLQPRILDNSHFYTALGSGKMSADPFLRFIVDTFCQDTQPTVKDAIFLATWTVQHVIDTNPGGVAGPIRISVLGGSPPAGCGRAYDVPETEIEGHSEAIGSARAALRKWRDEIAGASAQTAPKLQQNPQPELGVVAIPIGPR